MSQSYEVEVNTVQQSDHIWRLVGSARDIVRDEQGDLLKLQAQ